MVTFHRELSNEEIEKIKSKIDLDSIKEEKAIIVEEVAYVAMEVEDGFVIKKIKNII
ncbi:MAG: hypothetical protein ACRC30_01020 [Clostridium sp.]